MLKIEDLTLIPIDDLGKYMGGNTYLFKMIRKSNNFEMEFLYWKSNDVNIPDNITILPGYFSLIGWSVENKPLKGEIAVECKKIIDNANR